MNKRDIILDFTSLLDVVLIILFFFILYSHFETESERAAMQSQYDGMIAEAEGMIADAEELLLSAEEKDKLSEQSLAEAEAAGERQGENAAGIIEFGKGLNLRLDMKKGESGWIFEAFRGETAIGSFAVGESAEMSESLSELISGAGYTSEDTILCTFVYDADTPGSNRTYNKAKGMLDDLKRIYPHFFCSEIDLSITGG